MAGSASAAASAAASPSTNAVHGVQPFWTVQLDPGDWPLVAGQDSIRHWVLHHTIIGSSYEPQTSRSARQTSPSVRPRLHGFDCLGNKVHVFGPGLLDQFRQQAFDKGIVPLGAYCGEAIHLQLGALFIVGMNVDFDGAAGFVHVAVDADRDLFAPSSSS